MKPALRALPFFITLVCFSAYSDYVSARRKLGLIQSNQLKPGSRVTLSQTELNEYVRRELMEAAPAGVREPKVELGPAPEVVTGSALIDFGKIRRAQGKSPGWLMSKLLDGERPVKVTARIQSSGGRATVDVQNVEISGMTIEGRMLDFLVEQYLLPAYPTARLGQPFELGHRIDRLDVKPANVGVLIKP